MTHTRMVVEGGALCEFLAPRIFFFARIHERRFTRGTARSRAWNVLSRAFAFSPLKCWFESVFKRNCCSLFHCTLGNGNNLLKSLFFQRNASLTRFRSELLKFGASVPVFQLYEFDQIVCSLKRDCVIQSLHKL